MKRFRHQRSVRILAALLVWATPAASLEAAIGAGRDASIHHESAGEAASHVSGPTGEHGHEDGLPASQHQHGPAHQHGTSADHCSHIHTYCTTTSQLVGFADQIRRDFAREYQQKTVWFGSAEFPPPRF